MSPRVGISFSVVSLLFAVNAVGLPLPESGPHIANGWGESIRLRHLYAARHGVNLKICDDGTVDGSSQQSPYSLLEIRSVGTGFVAIKGVTSSHYLCMDENGKLYGSRTYVKESCSFLERILSDGYSVYVSRRSGAAVSLNRSRQRPQARGTGSSALSKFLPMVSTAPLRPVDTQLQDPGPGGPDREASHLELDSMDPFGKLSQGVIQSPSFNKR